MTEHKPLPTHPSSLTVDLEKFAPDPVATERAHRGSMITLAIVGGTVSAAIGGMIAYAASHNSRRVGVTSAIISGIVGTIVGGMVGKKEKTYEEQLYEMMKDSAAKDPENFERALQMTLIQELRNKDAQIAYAANGL